MLDRSIVLSEAGLDISHPIEKSDIGGFLLIVDLDGHPIEVEGLLPLFPQFVVTGLLFKFFDFHGLRTGNGVCSNSNPTEPLEWSPRRGGRNEERPDPWTKDGRPLKFN